MSRRAATYTLPVTAKKAPEPVPPSPSRVDRQTAYKCTEEIITLITDQSGLNEQEAVSLFITLASSVAFKNFSEGGARNPGRLQNVFIDKLTLQSFEENLCNTYPNITVQDAAAHVALMAFYFFEIRDVDQTEFEARIKECWDAEFDVKVGAIRNALNDFVEASGSADVFDYVKRNKAVHNEKKSVAARICQVTMTADIVGVVLEAVRRNPKLSEKIPADFLKEAVEGLTLESNLAPIAYNCPAPITLGGQINLLKETTVVKEAVQTDHTTLPLVYCANDRPTDESLRKLEHFGVSSRVSNFSLVGYHKYAEKRVYANTTDGKKELDLVALYCRDSDDPLVHQPYLLAALASSIHTLLKCSISKPAIAFRAGTAFRGECQRCMNKYGLIPSGAVVLPPKASTKAAKTKKSKRGSDTASNAPTDISTTTSAGSWVEDENMDDVSFKNAIVKDAALPGIALLSSQGVLAEHDLESVRNVMGDFLDYANSSRTTNAFRANSVARGLSYTCKSVSRPIFDAIANDIGKSKPGETVWFHEKCNSILSSIISGNEGGAREAVDLVMRQDQRPYVKKEYRLVLLRIVASCMMRHYETEGYNLSVVSTRIMVKRTQNQFRSGRRPNYQATGPTNRNQSRQRNNRGNSQGRWPTNR